MAKYEFEGTVRTREHVDREKSDMDMAFDRLQIKDSDGINVALIRGESGFEGFAPDQPVKVTIETVQTTLTDHEEKE